MGFVQEAGACSEKHLEGSRLGCPDTCLGPHSPSSPLNSLCLSSGSGSLVGIDNKIEQAMVREAILVPGGSGSCPAAPPLLSSLGRTNSSLLSVLPAGFPPVPSSTPALPWPLALPPSLSSGPDLVFVQHPCTPQTFATPCPRLFPAFLLLQWSFITWEQGHRSHPGP